MIADDTYITPSVLLHWINTLIKRFMNYSLYILALCCNILYNLSLQYILIYSICVDLIILIIIVKDLLKEKEKMLKTRLKIEIIERILMLIFKFTLLVYIFFPKFLITFSIIFLFFHALIRLSLYMIYKNKSECLGLLDFLSIVWRTFFLLMTLGIFLKFDGFINWTFKQVLLPFWIFFSLEVGLNFVVVLMIISKIMQKYYENVENCELIGLFWIFFQTLYYLLSGYFFLDSLIEIFDYHEQGF